MVINVLEKRKMVGRERDYKAIWAKVSKNSLDKEQQMQKLWSGSMTIMFQEGKEVITDKAEVGKGEYFQRGYQR